MSGATTVTGRATHRRTVAAILAALIGFSTAITPDAEATSRSAAQAAPVEHPEAVAVGAPPAGATYAGVKVTYYTVTGTMYSGGQTFEGAAAAHLGWLPIGTRFTLDCIPGQVYTVLDTGLMPPNWVDIYVRSSTTGVVTRAIAANCLRPVT